MDIKVSNSGVAPFAREVLVYSREHYSGIRRMEGVAVQKNFVSTERGSVCRRIVNGF